MFEFLAGLSFFWAGILFGVLALAAILFTSFGSYFWALGTVVFLVALSQQTNFGILDWLSLNWYGTLLGTGAYLAIGFAWATFAWFIHLNKAAAKYSTVREKLLPKFLKANNIQELTPDLHDEFRKFMEANAGTVLPKEQLAVNTGVMVGQVVLWPFKLVSFFLGDALKYAVEAFVSIFGGFFKRIQKFVFRNFPELQG